MHPDQNQITSYLLGTLNDESAEFIAQHLQNCDECEATVANLEAVSDTLIEKLRDGAPPDAFADEPTCRQMLSAIKAIGHERTEAFPKRARETILHESDADLGSIREYKLLAVLGHGGMGAVYKALHTKLDKIVALKVLPANLLHNGTAVSRFEREMKAVGMLNHPNIVTAHDAGEYEGRHYLVMELIKGIDLSILSARIGSLRVADACELIRQAAIGLQYAYEKGLVHRDIKPSNLMLTRREDGEVQLKVLDLGLALLDDYAHERSELTDAGDMMGTLSYMAPEQTFDSHQVNIRADIYSLGATLYKLICGDVPYSWSKYKTQVRVLTAIATAEPPSISTRRADLPAQLVQIIDRMLAKDADKRYATPQEVADALAPFTAGADLSALINDALAKFESNNKAGQLPLLPSTESATAATIDYSPSGAKPRESRSAPNTKTLITSLGLMGLIAVSLLAVIIYRIQTDKGTIIVEVDETEAAQIETQLKDGGLLIVNKENGEHWTIKPRQSQAAPSGIYQLQRAGGLLLSVTSEAGVKLNTDEFTLNRGHKLRVRVRLEPPRIAGTPKGIPLNSTDGAEVPVPATIAADTREAAEILIRARQEISVEANGQPRRRCRTVDELPSEPFVLRAIHGGPAMSQTDLGRLSELLAPLERLTFYTELEDIDSTLQILSRAAPLTSVEIFGGKVTGRGLAHLPADNLRSLTTGGDQIVDADL